jgi:hypothetical protein
MIGATVGSWSVGGANVGTTVGAIGALLSAVGGRSVAPDATGVGDGAVVRVFGPGLANVVGDALRVAAGLNCGPCNVPVAPSAANVAAVSTSMTPSGSANCAKKRSRRDIASARASSSVRRVPHSLTKVADDPCDRRLADLQAVSDLLHREARAVEAQDVALLRSESSFHRGGCYATTLPFIEMSTARYPNVAMT